MGSDVHAVLSAGTGERAPLLTGIDVINVEMKVKKKR